MEKEHLLVVRLSAMGDVAMTVPVLIALRRSHPRVSVSVLTKPGFAPIFSQLSWITVHTAKVKAEHKGVLGLWRLYKSLGQTDVTAVADLHHVLRSRILKLFFKLGGVPVAQLDKGRSEKKALTAPKNKVFRPLRSTHLRYADVFARLGLPLELTPKDVLPKAQLPQNVLEMLPKEQRKWVGIAPFAAFPGKCYPTELMKEVLKEQSGTGDRMVLLFGGGDKEEALLAEWEAEFDHCFSMAGKVSFVEELKVISNLDLMLAMDSGNAHLAAMYGVPTITLWGVTHPYAGFAPFAQPPQNALLSDVERYPMVPTSVYGNRCPPGYGRVMETIPPALVLKRMGELLLP
ncbi:glycosyltransferase family 9 protein [Maribacter sp. 2307ULW6-5]|uniref:glycosyltransferase family 9 protein n=1 Tax=Maribacter sp. 2307ULW6-5 TaxID=3386275 RepID=UPI0039BCA941